MLSRSATVLAALAFAELVVFVLAARRVSVLLLLVVVAAVSVSGVMFLFRQASGALRATVEDLTSARTDAADRLGDRGLRLLAGLLLAFPGLLTGVVGALLLLSPVRALARPVIGTRLDRLRPTDLGGLDRALRRRDVVDVDAVPRDPEGTSDNHAAPPELR